MRHPGSTRYRAAPSVARSCGPTSCGSTRYYTSHADYGWHVVDAAAARLRLLISVGTSLSVGVTSFLQSAASRSRAPVFLIDPGARPADAHPSSVHLRARAEEMLPSVFDALVASGGA